MSVDFCWTEKQCSNSLWYLSLSDSFKVLVLPLLFDQENTSELFGIGHKFEPCLALIQLFHFQQYYNYLSTEVWVL